MFRSPYPVSHLRVSSNAADSCCYTFLAATLSAIIVAVVWLRSNCEHRLRTHQLMLPMLLTEMRLKKCCKARRISQSWDAERPASLEGSGELSKLD